MYRIVVVSDTHHHLDYVISFLDNLSSYDMIIHLGDNVSDAEKIEKLYPGVPLVAVCGNNDFGSRSAPIEREYVINGVKLFLTHGHKYGVKFGYERIYFRAAELDSQVALFGHSHIPLCVRENGVLLLNPGGYNSMQRSVGIVEIEDGKAKGCLIPC